MNNFQNALKERNLNSIEAIIKEIDSEYLDFDLSRYLIPNNNKEQEEFDMFYEVLNFLKKERISYTELHNLQGDLMDCMLYDECCNSHNSSPNGGVRLPSSSYKKMEAKVDYIDIIDDMVGMLYNTFIWNLYLLFKKYNLESIF